MIEINFIDGTNEMVECVKPSKECSFIENSYNKDSELFTVKKRGYHAMFPREFIKSIKYIDE